MPRKKQLQISCFASLQPVFANRIQVFPIRIPTLPNRHKFPQKRLFAEI